MKLTKIINLLLIIPVLLFTSGCASYRFGRLPSPYVNDQPNPLTKNDVSVAIKIFNASEAQSVFDCEMAPRKINPMYIVIDNKSKTAYTFRKADVDTSYLSSEDVAKKCARSTMTRILGYGFLGLFIISWIIFIPMAIAEGISCPRLNAQMKNDYMSNEIADTTIAPERSISGVMFVAPFRSGEQITIPLVNRDTGEKLLFQFQNTQLGAIYEAPQEKPQEKKESKDSKNSKMNFAR